MAINLKLGPRTELSRQEQATDPMNREWVGYSHRATAEEIFEQNRGVWYLGRRAQTERYATLSFNGEVALVAEIDDIVTLPWRAPGRGRDKQAIVGRVLPAGHPAHDAFIGRKVDTHRNPVTYLEDPEGLTPARTCACGCGEPTLSARDFLAGHDQRAVHERITRQWGSTLAFVEWFDATYPTA